MPSSRRAVSPAREADRIYAEATVFAPALTSLWIEWAYVDIDRHRLPQALDKLARAVALDDSRVDAWLLRGQVHTLENNARDALADYDAALSRAPGNADAVRGRDIARAALESSSTER